MKRLFIAIPVYPTQKLIKFSEQLQTIAPYPAVKWVNPEQYHLTLQFLGDTDEDVVSGISRCLAIITNKYEQFDFSVEKTGKFTDRQGNLKIIWAGINPTQPFIALNKDIYNLLKESGFVFSHKRFKAHLTLGRVKHLKDPSELYDMLRKYTNAIFAKQKAVEFNLIESKLTSAGPEYHIIETFKLK